MKHLCAISKVPVTAQTIPVSPTGIKLAFMSDFLDLLVPLVDAKYIADNPA